MSFPNIKNKYSLQPFFSPKDFLKYARENGQMPDFEIPDSVIFCYETTLKDFVLRNEDVKKIEFFISELYLLSSYGKSGIGVCTNFGIGPSGVVTVMEELIALGTKRFISIGYAGGLQKKLNIGDVVVCTKAVRDEGVSYHYCKPSKFSYPSERLTEKLKNSLKRSNLSYHEGVSWTIDAPYRETVSELRYYQKIGILSVEMEASALCAVARLRKRDFATAFVVSDSLADLVWNPQFDSRVTIDSLCKLYQIAINVLSK